MYISKFVCTAGPQYEGKPVFYVSLPRKCLGVCFYIQTHTAGLPYEGVSKTLMCGRHLSAHAPAKRQTWTALRPRSAPADFEPSPWTGYAAFHSYF